MDTQDQNFTETVLHTPFFPDFMVFLGTLQERPLMLTKTGNLQERKLSILANTSRLISTIEMTKERSFILFIRKMKCRIYKKFVLSHRVMHLTYQRKGQLHLSSNGKRFLQHLDPQTQFEHMVLCSFRQCHWADLYPYVENLASLLQKINSLSGRAFCKIKPSLLTASILLKDSVLP